MIRAARYSFLLSVCLAWMHAQQSSPPAPPGGSPGAKKGTTRKVQSSTPPLDPAHFNAPAPVEFRAKFITTKGGFVIDVHRDWAPLGADRFYNLVRSGFFQDASFFRVIAGFMVQFGIASDPIVNGAWSSAVIRDDPVTRSNKRGNLTFASKGPNTRTTQVFINFRDNPSLDGQGFAPLGEVVEGIEVVDKLYSGYGEGSPNGTGPAQDRLAGEGRAYVDQEFSLLDRVISAVVIDDPRPTAVGQVRPSSATPRQAEGTETSIRREVARIERGQHSDLPPPVASSARAGDSSGAVRRTVANGTSYTLTVMFDGPVARRITLAPGATQQLQLPPGTYKVAARVPAPNVLPFFGEQSYSEGQGYTSHFYIRGF
jgi:peptidyl-prolyl cis-trans isomerase A (cyclophilin A)